MAARQPARGRATRAKTSSSAKSGDGELRSSREVKTAFISGNTFRARAVQYVVVDGDAMFEGDIVLGTAEQVEQESEISRPSCRGEFRPASSSPAASSGGRTARVPYDIDPALPNQNARDRRDRPLGVEHPLPLRRYGPRPTPHLPRLGHVQTGQRLLVVGRQPRRAAVRQPRPGCTTGNTIHEIGHTVGLWHEQSARTATLFVTINWANIQSGFEHNFDQHITDGDDVGPYDYGSIMHYPRNAFGVGGAETITPTDPNAQIGQRTALSAGDIATANTLCPGKQSVETLKEFGPETIKERIAETIKERNPETIKERIPETTKELIAETIKERIPETVKELIAETVKERFPETVKEQIPETAKEQIPETAKESSTRPSASKSDRTRWSSGCSPGRAGRSSTRRSEWAARLPFAMMTTHVGATGDALVDDVVARLGAIEEALAGLEANQMALSEQLAAVFGQLGLQ